MTRKEIEQLYVEEPNCFETDREEQWYKVGLKEGLAASDFHPHWIPVEERLPEMYERVLVAGLDKRSKLKEPLLFVTCRAKEECGIKCDSNGFSVGNIPFAYKKVTHWMPLPAAPRKEVANET